MRKLLKAIGRFFVRLGELIQDQGGAYDIKLALGALFLIMSLVYVIWIKRGDLSGFGAIAGVGITLIGGSALADQGKLGGPTPPTTGGLQ